MSGLLCADCWRCGGLPGKKNFGIARTKPRFRWHSIFAGDGIFHPVIELPEKQPLAYEPRWSRRAGVLSVEIGASLADIGHDFGDEHARSCSTSAVARALATHESFLPGESDREKVMDRLHAYCYFLEALLAVADRDDARHGAGFRDRPGGRIVARDCAGVRAIRRVCAIASREADGASSGRRCRSMRTRPRGGRPGAEVSIRFGGCAAARRILVRRRSAARCCRS